LVDSAGLIGWVDGEAGGMASGNGKQKTPTKTPTNPGRNGNRLKVGNPGNRGGPGRPPNEYRDAMRQIAYNAAQIERIKAWLSDPDVRVQLQAWMAVADRGYGKPTQPIESEVTHRHYVVEAPKELSRTEWVHQYAPEVQH